MEKTGEHQVREVIKEPVKASSFSFPVTAAPAAAMGGRWKKVGVSFLAVKHSYLSSHACLIPEHSTSKIARRLYQLLYHKHHESVSLQNCFRSSNLFFSERKTTRWKE